RGADPGCDRLEPVGAGRRGEGERKRPRRQSGDAARFTVHGSTVHCSVVKPASFRPASRKRHSDLRYHESVFMDSLLSRRGRRDQSGGEGKSGGWLGTIAAAPLPLRLGLGGGFALAGWGIQWIITGVLGGDALYLPFFPMLAGAAFLLGFWSGVVCTALSSAIVWMWLIGGAPEAGGGAGGADD